MFGDRCLKLEQVNDNVWGRGVGVGLVGVIPFPIANVRGFTPPFENKGGLVYEW